MSRFAATATGGPLDGSEIAVEIAPQDGQQKHFLLHEGESASEHIYVFRWSTMRWVYLGSERRLPKRKTKR